MTFAQLANTYLAANILIVLAVAFFGLVYLLLAASGRALRSGLELKLHYFALLLLLGATFAQPFLPKREMFQPVAKVWAAGSAKSFSAEYGAKTSGYLALSSAAPLLPVGSASTAISLAAALLLLLGGLRFLLDLRKLLWIRSAACLIRKIHGLHIYVSEEVKIPFSFRLPGERSIMLPERLIGRPESRIAVKHEIQHHRQGDTAFLYLLWAVRLAFLANPLVHLWSRWMAEIQEFACDEALVGQRKVEPQAYASCLLEVAQTVTGQERFPVCATGLSFLAGHNILKRRIQSMLEEKTKKMGWRAALPIGAAIVAVLSSAAYASQSLVQDRRITMAQAREMARAAQGTGEFPVVVNEKVLKWLNYFEGTPDGREKIRAALARMENYKGTIGKKLEQYRLPEELLAVPLIESGYQNLEAARNPVRAAGLWQFIASTARNFGLRVSEETDDRLNVELETDAAMRLLLVNRLRFNDWHLSILAYNSGERAVQSAMDATGSRNPWVLIDSYFTSEESKEYLPKLMAGILLMRNPASLQ